MPTIEERVAYLGRLGDHFAAVDEFRFTYREFHADSNRQFTEARAALELLRADTAREFGEVRGRSDELSGELRIGSAVVGLYFK